jgi:hypothetical protein
MRATNCIPLSLIITLVRIGSLPHERYQHLFEPLPEGTAGHSPFRTHQRITVAIIALQQLMLDELVLIDREWSRQVTLLAGCVLPKD